MNNKLKEFRKELGINQYELADAAKVPRYKIQLAEQGISVLSTDELERILKKLGLSSTPTPDWCLSLIDNEVSDA